MHSAHGTCRKAPSRRVNASASRKGTLTSTSAIGPLVSMPRPSRPAAPTYPKRRSRPPSEAHQQHQRAPVIAAASGMSNRAWRAMQNHSRLEPSTTVLQSASRGPNTRRAIPYTSAVHRAAQSIVGSRKAPSVSPNRAMLAASIQCSSGGLSR